MRKLLSQPKDKGFTLIELMTSITLFIVVMTISMGAILGVFENNRKSQALKAVMSNLNLSIESMSREMRFGENYHCGTSGTLTLPQNCPSGESFISFLSSDDIQISYRLNGNIIEKSVAGGAWIPMTAPEVDVQELEFYVLGAGTQTPLLQPKVFIKLIGVAGADESSRTEFNIQTLVSQRPLDD